MKIARFFLCNAAILGVLLLAVAGIAFAFQRSVIFPVPDDFPRAAASGFDLVHALTGDGLRISAYYRPAVRGKATVIFFHGNADNLLGAAEATRGLRENGNGLMLIEYRGYGGNAGTPTERGLYLDGAAGMRWLAERGVRSKDVIVIGQSVGSGPATETALRNPVAGLALISAFSSLPEAVRDAAPLVPRWLVRDRFDNAAKLTRVAAPVLLMHGNADSLISPDHFRRLVRARPDATHELFAGAGHDLGYSDVAQAALVDWVNGLDAEHLATSR